MTRDDATAELARMVAGLSETDTELLERISTRVDSLELRDALVEAGARAVVAAPVTVENGVRG